MPVGHRARIAGDGAWGLWFERTGSNEEPVLDENGDLVFDPETGELVVRRVPVGVWSFGRPGAEVRSQTSTAPGAPVELVGVHDAVAGTVALYLDGDRQADARPFDAAASSGTFTLGGTAAADTGSTGPFPGRITGLAVWAGAMSNAQQVAGAFGS